MVLQQGEMCLMFTFMQYLKVFNWGQNFKYVIPTTRGIVGEWVPDRVGRVPG